MSKLTILVTGANQGLGYHEVHQLALTHNFHILLAARDFAKGQAAVQKLLSSNPSIDAADLEPIQLDIDSDASIAAAVKYVDEKHGKLDILLNNAAIANGDKDKSLREQLSQVCSTNMASSYVVTQAFLPLIRKSRGPSPARRITFVSSDTASFTLTSDPNHHFHGSKLDWTFYRASKSGLNMIVAIMAGQLKDEGIAVNMVTPGFVATNLNDHSEYATQQPEDGAATIVKAATQGENETISGTFSSDYSANVPW